MRCLTYPPFSFLAELSRARSLSLAFSPLRMSECWQLWEIVGACARDLPWTAIWCAQQLISDGSIGLAKWRRGRWRFGRHHKSHRRCLHSQKQRIKTGSEYVVGKVYLSPLPLPSSPSFLYLFFVIHTAAIQDDNRFSNQNNKLRTLCGTGTEKRSKSVMTKRQHQMTNRGPWRVDWKTKSERDDEKGAKYIKEMLVHKATCQFVN